MRVVFMGTGDIAVPSLRWLLHSGSHEVAAVVTQPDRPVGRRQEMTAPPVKQAVAERGMPLFQPEKIRDSAAVEFVASIKPEVIVVMAYGQILPKTLLEVPRIACINLHASLLPRHRGAAPVQAAILAGEAESGITVMHMEAGLDTGDIILQKALRVRRRETGGSLHARLAALAPQALSEALELLETNSAPRNPQDEVLATYCPKLTREDGRIDWTEKAPVIERKIRAMNPWPGAFTMLEGRKLKVFSAIQLRRQSALPGVILRVDLRGIAVGTGSGALLLREMQVEGKRRMPAREFLAGNPVPVGSSLQ